jgi:hypothetical protein
MKPVSTVARSAAAGLMAGATVACASARQAPPTPGDAQTLVIPAAPSSATEEDPALPAGPRGTARPDEPSGAKDCCMGMNDCKGKGGCKTAANECRGLNECKGQGGCGARCPD